MKHIEDYSDERMRATCLYCGGGIETRDHCPSKVFLDEPYPENLPFVRCCRSCNNGFSADEEYLACLLECVLAGGTNPAGIRRQKIARILSAKAKLRALIETSMQAGPTGPVFVPNPDRVQSIALKLARGHVLHQLSEVRREMPEDATMTSKEIAWFENPESVPVWPEVGSRAMQRLVRDDYTPWLVVQPGLYRFSAVISDGIEVRIVLREYLACYFRWA